MAPGRGKNYGLARWRAPAEKARPRSRFRGWCYRATRAATWVSQYSQPSPRLCGTGPVLTTPACRDRAASARPGATAAGVTAAPSSAGRHWADRPASTSHDRPASRRRDTSPPAVRPRRARPPAPRAARARAIPAAADRAARRPAAASRPGSTAPRPACAARAAPGRAGTAPGSQSSGSAAA